MSFSEKAFQTGQEQAGTVRYAATVWTRQGSHRKPDELRGGLHRDLKNLETKSNRTEWSELKLSS